MRSPARAYALRAIVSALGAGWFAFLWFLLSHYVGPLGLPVPLLTLPLLVETLENVSRAVEERQRALLAAWCGDEP